MPAPDGESGPGPERREPVPVGCGQDEVLVVERLARDRLDRRPAVEIKHIVDSFASVGSSIRWTGPAGSSGDARPFDTASYHGSIQPWRRVTRLDHGPLTPWIPVPDLRGYTAFAESRGDIAAAELLDRYRALVRAVVADMDGAEIKTEGDSFYVVFPVG